MAKKKAPSGSKPKQYGTLIRVSAELADAIRKASQFEGVSMAIFGDRVILPLVEKRYREGIVKAAKKIEGEGDLK